MLGGADDCEAPASFIQRYRRYINLMFIVVLEAMHISSRIIFTNCGCTAPQYKSENKTRLHERPDELVSECRAVWQGGGRRQFGMRFCCRQDSIKC